MLNLTRTSVLAGLTCFFLQAPPLWAELPFAKHGWSAQEAAAHLLSRTTFGARPGEVEAVARRGLEDWLEEQLQDEFPDQLLADKLEKLPEAYRLDNEGIIAAYPNQNQLKRRIKEIAPDEEPLENGRALDERRAELGYRPFKELSSTLFAQKLYHGLYSESQVKEVLTEFWFNHFNVAFSNTRARPYLLSYERDALRPNALGSFRTLLEATAKHPAMLWYLDNATSTAGAEALTTTEMGVEAGLSMEANPKAMQRLQKRKKGLNENYARELMELHTLGVDGGYSQTDVTEAARVLTGWTAVPYERLKMEPFLSRELKSGAQREGDFLFAAPLHDAQSKTVLSQNFAAGGGKEEGERLLDLLAVHPSTAQHLARKFAIRFISDSPSDQTVEMLSGVFLKSQGDSKAMVRAVVNSDEFWVKSQRGTKIKSPLELLLSAARILEADLEPTRQVYGWLMDMGQPLYDYQAPTGFPDKAEFWISSGTVLQRMNFGLQASGGNVLGFSYNLPNLERLEETAIRLLPAGWDVGPVVERLKPLLTQAADLDIERPGRPTGKGNLGGQLPDIKPQRMKLTPSDKKSATMVGLILGSPDFQRR